MLAVERGLVRAAGQNRLFVVHSVITNKETGVICRELLGKLWGSVSVFGGSEGFSL